LLGLLVIGRSTHAARPFHGVDAAQWAAAIVDRITTSEALTRAAGGIPPVALRMRDAKTRYDAQTAREAEIEFNLVAFDQPLRGSLELLRREIEAAIEDVARRTEVLARAGGLGASRPRARVLAS